MGIPWEDSEKVGTLIGLKTMVNEFVAFEQLGKMTLTVRIKPPIQLNIFSLKNLININQ